MFIISIQILKKSSVQTLWSFLQTWVNYLSQFLSTVYSIALLKFIPVQLSGSFNRKLSRMCQI